MRTSRKMEHVFHALRLGQSGQHGLADVKLIHNCLPETSSQLIKLHTTIGELQFSSPILINAMTGGSQETETINRELAVVAREKKLAMAVGSQMAAIKDKTVESSYRIVRKMNPDGIVFANIGSEATLDQAMRAIEMVEANALQIHLNVMQELIMPEGDRNFIGMEERIASIVMNVPVPVIVKEVGFGIMRESATRLQKLGVKIIDVGGTGGTNFAEIENERRSDRINWLNDWGSKTSIALLESLSVYPRGTVIASGGIRTPIDIVKALSTGASLVGMAGALLRVLKNEGTEKLLAYVDELHEGLIMVMTALGTTRIEQLWKAPLVITGETAEWCSSRGIDLTEYANREGNRSNFC